MDATTDNPPRGEHDRYVFLPLPRCPLCESLDLKLLRTEHRDELSITRRFRCTECKHVFFVVWD